MPLFDNPVPINTQMLRPSDVGKWVIYTNGVGETERGKLKSWNDNNLFVVFQCNNEWERFQDFTGSSCNPKDVHFETLSDRANNCVEHYYLPFGKYQDGKKCQNCGDEIGTTWDG